MRRKIIAGNWKMHKTVGEAVRLCNAIKVKTVNIQKTDIVICPTFLSLVPVNECLKESILKLGAQNLFWEESGAYTGEVSGPMLRDAGCEYVIIGHSERRQYFSETDATVNNRIEAALEANLKPIVCVGETLEERESRQTFDIVEKQLVGAFANITYDQIKEIIIAYEPVWAIGTGKNAAPEQAQEVHHFIRNKVAALYDAASAESIRIQYGGSVKPENAKDILDQGDIDGALVGGASLDAGSFCEIIKSAEIIL